MDEEIAVDVPAIQILGRDIDTTFTPEVDYECVSPVATCWLNTGLATAELTSRCPRPRGKFGGIESSMLWHVDAFFCPGAFIRRRHAQAHPDVLGHLLGLLSGECTLDPIGQDTVSSSACAEVQRNLLMSRLYKRC